MLNRFEKFVYNITEIDLYWHRLAANVMKEHGLKGNYVVYFTMLHKFSDGLTALELSKTCGRDKADISRDVAALVAKGLMKRIQGVNAKYRTRILLTEEGRKVADTVIKRAETAVFHVGGHLDDEERETFYKVLDQITDNMRTLSQSGFPAVEAPEMAHGKASEEGRA
ncbi:MAG: hypothetical protein Q4B73_04150 [Lachnospiraceae bacterium]|nr:hypothetical protein [Lachnospiraceae bacterium]